MATVAPRFLNVDVEVESSADLDPLVAVMARGAFHLANYRRGGRHHVRFELATSPRSADHGIRAFAKLLNRLPPKARRLWNAARRRDFDIGIQAPRRSDSAILELSREAVQLASKLRGRILFTVYAAGGKGSPSNKRLKLTGARK